MKSYRFQNKASLGIPKSDENTVVQVKQIIHSGALWKYQGLPLY